jgi:hypothetical protein
LDTSGLVIVPITGLPSGFLLFFLAVAMSRLDFEGACGFRIVNFD